jgi:CheY-like chemotaxis protein
VSTRILVVDDSSTIRKVVTAILERHGFESVAAADGLLALEAIDKAEGGKPFDLVLLDFVMPRMNGFQFCRALRSRETHRNMPVVLMSAKSDKIRDQFVQQTGAIDAITKPFDAQALVAVIEHAIQRSETFKVRGESLVTSMPEEFELVDSLRPPPMGGDPVSGRSVVALSGDIGIIPFGAALQLLQLENQTGILHVANGRSEVSIALRRGLIDLVQSRGAGQEFRLGRYFVELGVVTPADIDRLLREQLAEPPSSGDLVERKSVPPSSSFVRREESTGMRNVRLLGDLLVGSGKVSQEQLRDALARQSSELIYEVLRWERGRFEFRREPPPPLAESAKLGLPVALVVMEGFRRVDEWRLVETGLGSFDSVLLKDPASIESVGPAGLQAVERTVLDLVDGERSVREIIAASNMSSFDVCKVLYQLLEARLVRRRAA